jgi:exodeoxyribonuclease V beta subunit
MSDAQPFDAASISLSGKNLIEASAGTGKTYAITTLFVRLLLEKELNPADILVVTFTEAATLELRERVRSRVVEARVAFEAALTGSVPEDEALRSIIEQRGAALGRGTLGRDLERLDRALRSIDEAPISTLHGFCQRVLSDNAFGTRMPFDAELVADLSDLQDDLLYDFWQAKVGNGPEGLARQLDALGIGVKELRQLMREGLRNPRIRVIPSFLTEAGSQELSAVLQEVVKRAGEVESALQFVADNCVKEAYGGGPGMERLLAEMRECFAITDVAKLYVPKRADQLSPSNIERNLYKKSKGQKAPPFFELVERLVIGCGRGVLKLQHELLAALKQELARRKLAAHVLGFDDLLIKVADALSGPGGKDLAHSLRKRFRAVLIDEVQDTDPVQFEIFEAAFSDGTHPLFLIGDPKQAIYGFRGADVFAYLAAAKGAHRFTLGTSYRSDPGVVSAINALFRPEGRFLVPGIGYADVQAKPGARNQFRAPYLSGRSQTAALDVLLLKRADEKSPKSLNKTLASHAVARATAADIVRLLDEGATIAGHEGERKVHAGDIAVLTRTNDQGFLVQDALHERGVHAVVIGDKSVFDSAQAAEVQAVLTAVLDPKSRSDLRRALATSMIGVTGDDFATHENDVQFWQRWVSNFQGWHELWVARGFMRMFQAFLSQSLVSQNLLRRVGGERRLTNVLHLAELLHRASREQQLGPAALLAWLNEQRTLRPAKAEQAEIRLESDEAAVKIMTAHLAKGLEFSLVYCPYLWSGRGGFGIKGRELHRCHDPKQAWRATLDIDVDESARDASKEAAKWEDFAEEIRVAYVALTRAKHRTTVVWGGFNTLPQSPTAFLLHGTDSPLLGQRPVLPDLGKKTDGELQEDLEQKLRRCGFAAAVRAEPWGYDAVRSRSDRADPGRLLQALTVESAITTWRHTSSFSRLAKHDPRSVVAHFDQEEGRDHDQAPLLLAAEADSTAEPTAARTAPSPITLATFPRGARAGNLFHEILEEIDFAAEDSQLELITAAKLRSYGIAGSPAQLEQWREEAVTGLKQALAAPLLPATFALRDVQSPKRLVELEFRMPVGSRDLALTRQRLAKVFRDHPSQAVSSDYPAHIEALGFRDLAGFLVGFIDLVFEHEGRWFVVDYKTNHLGDALGDYDTPAMARAMSESHYYLQYHLYTVALHRYLAHFLKRYDYEHDFGGVFYLFLKGMHPKAPAGSGVFFEKPPLARIEALSRLLAGATESRGAA